MPRSAKYLVVTIRWWIDHEPRILYPPNELADRDLGLQPREWATETEMDTAAVAKVLVVLAFEVDLVWVCEPARVAVARPVDRDDRRALWNGRSRNRNIFEGGAGWPELDRRFEAEELLDPRHDHFRPPAQFLEGFVVPQQGEHAVGDQVDRGLVAGKEQKHGIAQEFVVGQVLLRFVVHHRREHARSG